MKLNCYVSKRVISYKQIVDTFKLYTPKKKIVNDEI